jgi:hypothetical protein
MDTARLLALELLKLKPSSELARLLLEEKSLPEEPKRRHVATHLRRVIESEKQ